MKLLFHVAGLSSWEDYKEGLWKSKELINDWLIVEHFDFHKVEHIVNEF